MAAAGSEVLWIMGEVVGGLVHDGQRGLRDHREGSGRSDVMGGEALHSVGEVAGGLAQLQAARLAGPRRKWWKGGAMAGGEALWITGKVVGGWHSGGSEQQGASDHGGRAASYGPECLMGQKTQLILPK